MKILFVNNSYKLFKEADSGASNRSTMFIRSLAQFADVEVVSFTPVCESDIPHCKVIYYEDFHYEENKTSFIFKIKHLFNLLRSILHPNKVTNFYTINEEKSSIIRKILCNSDYNFVACRYFEDAVSCSLFDYANKLILDVDDTPKSAFIVQVNEYYHNDGKKESFLYRYIKKLYIKRKVKSIDIITRNFLSKVYCSFYSNPLDKPYPSSIYLHNVAIANYKIPDEMTIDHPIILMVGWYTYLPNYNGAIHFVKNVWGKVKKAIPNAEFHVVGKYADNSFVRIMEANDGVIVKGFVEDLFKEYSSSNVVIVPIYEGSGTSVKVIEAMQMNRPVISTPKGVRGIEQFLTNGKDYLRADSDKEFSDKIIMLLNSDLKEINKIAHNGNLVIKKFFSQEKFMNIVKNNIIK